MSRLAYTTALAVVGLLAYQIGYHDAPTELLDEQVEQRGLFTVDSKATLAAAVLSLRAENKLLVYSYKADAQVAASRSTMFGLISGRQLLLVPAAVGYYADVSALRPADVTYDAASQSIEIRLPALVLGDVAFRPERATIVNSGLLTWDFDKAASLLRANYRTARAAFVKQAQQESLVKNAEAHADEAVGIFFRLAFQAAGAPLKTVSVKFKKRPPLN